MGTAQSTVLLKGQCWRSNHLSGDRHVSLSTPQQISPILREGGRTECLPHLPLCVGIALKKPALPSMDTFDNSFPLIILL